MLSSSARQLSRKFLARNFVESGLLSNSLTNRFKSTSAQEAEDEYLERKDGVATDVVSFPVSSGDSDDTESQPILLNASEHAVGYLSRILNARVYEAAVETELQEAKNLSAVGTCE